jgi:hypothetical protein
VLLLLLLLLLQAADGYKWTHRLLQTNPKMQEAINTLLELAYLPPHTSLHAGKVGIAFTSECTHDLGLTGRTSSLMLLSAQQQLEAVRFRNMVSGCADALGADTQARVAWHACGSSGDLCSILAVCSPAVVPH